MVALSTKILLFTASIFTLVSAEPQTEAVVTITNAAQASAIASRLVAYEASLTTNPQWSSVNSVLSTAIPSSVLPEISAAADLFNTNKQDTLTTESWYTALPSDVKGYLVSVGNDVKSVLTATVAAGAAPTGLGRVAGMGAGLAGAVGAALLL
jgi:hypothetical protein